MNLEIGFPKYKLLYIACEMPVFWTVSWNVIVSFWRRLKVHVEITSQNIVAGD